MASQPKITLRKLRCLMFTFVEMSLRTLILNDCKTDINEDPFITLFPPYNHFLIEHCILLLLR